MGKLTKDDNGQLMQLFEPKAIIAAAAGVPVDCSDYVAFSNSVASDYSFNGGLVDATLQAGSIRGCSNMSTITFVTATNVEFM